MADKKINVVFDASVKANVGNLKGIVGKLQNELNNLEMPSGVTKNFEKEIKTLVDELQVFESLTAGGIGNLGDAKKVNASWEKISGTLRRITGQINDLGNMPDVLPKDVSKNVKQITNGINAYQKALQEAREANEYLNKAEEKRLTQAAKKRNLDDKRKEEGNLNKKRDEVELNQLRYNQRDQKKEEQLRKKQQEINQERIDLQKQIDEQTEIITKYQDKKILTKKDLSVNANATTQAKKETDAIEAERKKIEEEINEAEQQLIKKRKEIKSTKGKISRREGKTEKAEELKAEKEKLTRLNEEVTSLKEQIKQKKENLETVKNKEGETTADIRKANEALVKRGALEKQLSEKTLSADETDFLKNIDGYLDNIEKAKAETEKIINDINDLDTLIKDKDIEIAKIDSEMLDIEQTGTKEAWNDLIQTLQQIPNLDISNLKSLEDVKKALDDYKVDALKKVPEALQNIKNSASGTAGAMKQVDQAVDGATSSFKDLTREQQDMERFKDNILDFFSIGNTVQIFKNALRDAFDTVKELDAAMTETAVVTDFSIGDMWEKLPEYSKTASELGSSIKDLYGATTLYYQQGLNTEQAMSVGIETMKMARIANMEGADATKAMTAALRGFNMEINETSAKRVNDVYSELAAITAADTQQIATAMTKTASIADSANMDFEVTAALLAQIIETTQEAPETAGTALKTIIARFTEVKELFSEGMLTGKDSEGEAININKIDAALQTVGISLKDFLNGSKGIDDIFLELASKWDTLDLATQRYIATTAAGSRQQSRFIAMMSNYDRTMELVGAANDSAGASNEQFDKTLDSLDAKLERLNNAWQEFTMNLANNEIIKFGVDALAGLLETINSITEALSGGNGIIKSFLTLGEVALALNSGRNIFNSIFSGFKSKAIKALPEDNAFTQLLKAFGPKEEKSMVEKIGIFSDAIANIALLDKKGRLGQAAGKMVSFLPKLEFSTEDILDNKTYHNLIEIFTKDFSSYGDIVADSFIDSIWSAKNLAEFRQSFQNFIQKSTLSDEVKKELLTSFEGVFQKGQIGDSFESVLRFGDAEPLKKQLTNVFDIGKKKAKSFGKAITKFVKSPFGKVAGIALLTAGVLKKVWEHTNLDAQTEQVYNKFNDLKTATSEAKNELISIQDSRDVFQSLEDKVHNLTEGTLEWKEAMAELNEKVLELKSQYPDLEIIRDGKMFTIDESSWNKVIDKQQRSVDILENSKLSAQLEVDEINHKKTLIDLVRDTSKFSGFFMENLYSLFSSEFMNTRIEKTFNGTIDSHQQLRDMVKQENSLYEAQKQARVRSFVDTSLSSGIVEADRDLITGIIAATGLQTTLVDAATGTVYDVQQSIEERLHEQEKSLASLSDKSLREKYTAEFGIGGEELSREALIEALAAARVSGEIEAQSNVLKDNLNKLDSKSKEKLSELFSQEGADISTATLQQYYKEGVLNKEALERDYNIEAMAKASGVSTQDFYKPIETNLEIAKNRVEKQRKDVVKNLSQYGNTLNGQVTDDAAMLALLEAKFGDYILETFDSAIKNLEYTGDKDLISAGIQGLQTTAQYGTKADVEQIANFINEVNWSSPIDAASALNDELKTGTNLTKEFAQGMLNVNSSFLGAGSQIQHLWDTASDTGLTEALDEIIAANGEITGADIAGLTKDYQSLDKMLKNTGISASGVAKALDMISKGEMNIQSLTNAVAASLAGFGGLSDMINDVISQIGEWDMGTDEGQIGDFASQLYETANELISSGQRGNTQLDKIFGLVYGHDYLRGKVGDERKAALEAGLEGIAGLKDGNMSSIWNKIGALDASVQEQAGNLRVSYKNGEAFIDGYEGMTTAQIVENIRNLSQVAGFSDNEMFAKMLLGDASNYSDYIRPILSQNDLDLGLDRAYGAANEYKDQKVMDESEIEAIAQLYNEDASEVRNKLLQQAAENGEKIAFTNFYDENGQLKDTEGILQEIVNTQIKLSNTTNQVAYTTEGWIKRFGEGTQESSLRVHELQQELANMGVPDDKIDQMTEDMVNGLRNAVREAEVEVKFPDGSVDDITVKDGQSFAEAYNQAMKQFEYDSIGKAMASAFVDMDIDASGIYEEVHGQIESANENAIITIKNEGAEGITKAINTAINNANKTVKLNVSPTTIEISGSASGAIHLNAYKDGIVNASYAHPALVGEEGPELVETQNGAYIAGVDGPEITNINKGDTVHTATETKKILKGNRHKQIPRFSGGKPGPTLQAYGDMLKGAGGSGKDEAWETSIDKLYNLLREIQEETRYRNSIERRYERMLESLYVSATQLVDLSRQELSQLQEEKQLQEQLIKGRQDQIDEYMQDNQDFTKYAWVEQNERGEDVLRIDWEKINSITDKKLGEDVSKYLTQLEDWFGDIEGAQDAIDEITDQVFEINQRGKDEYFDLEDKIKDALVESYQDEIDKLSEINDTINDTNTKLLDSIQKSISQIRQDRENAKTEEEIFDMRQRLAYLQQDTSGANTLEILELQKEIAEKSEDYTDSLIDQKIDKLQEQNDIAAEQRVAQINIMQQQLDHFVETGQIWDEVYSLMNEGLHPDGGLVGGSKLEEILQKSENFAGLSTLGKMKWLEGTNQLIAQGLGYLYQGRQLENLGLETDSTIQFIDSEGKVLSGKLLDGGDVKVGDKVYKDIYQGHDGKYYSLGQVEDYVPKVNDQKPSGDNNDGNDEEGKDIEKDEDKDNKNPGKPIITNTHGYTRAEEKDQEDWLKSQLSQEELDSIARLEDLEKAESNPTGVIVTIPPVEEIVEEMANNDDLPPMQPWYKRFASGGLADFTGPAWLDGTKSRPEYILNAQQTKSFFTLVDTLESLKYKPSNKQTENHGDTIYDIDINIETVKEEADVDMLVDKVQKSIVSASQYRNNNAIKRR